MSLERNNLTRKEARALVKEAQKDLNQRLANNEIPYGICEKYFGLEPDYLHDVILFNSNEADEKD